MTAQREVWRRLLGEIRARAEAADQCKRCGNAKDSTGHTETLEQCNARLMAETAGTKNERGCWSPEDHHPYEPGGINEYDGDSGSDRASLLAQLDEAEVRERRLADKVVEALDVYGSMGNGEGWTLDRDVIGTLWLALSAEDKARTGYDVAAMDARQLPARAALTGGGEG